MLFEQAQHRKDYQLFVLHDADPYGYNICRTLAEETRRMPGHAVQVIDLGLSLETALDLGLETETFTRRQALPEGLVLTEREQTYFGGTRVGHKQWRCHRVELNALTAPQLIALITQGLEAARPWQGHSPRVRAHAGGARRLPVPSQGHGGRHGGPAPRSRCPSKPPWQTSSWTEWDWTTVRQWVDTAFATQPTLRWTDGLETEARAQAGALHDAVQAAVQAHMRQQLAP